MKAAQFGCCLGGPIKIPGEGSQLLCDCRASQRSRLSEIHPHVPLGQVSQLALRLLRWRELVPFELLG